MRYKTRNLHDEQIEKWIDDDLQIISEIEKRDAEDVEYRFLVWCKNFSLNIFKPEGDSPLVLATESVFPKKELDILQGIGKDHFVSQVTSILTLAPGFYTFTDGNGKSTDLENMEAIYIEHRIYPDKASRHELNNSIINMFTALMYVQSIIDRVTSNINNRR